MERTEINLLTVLLICLCGCSVEGDDNRDFNCSVEVVNDVTQEQFDEFQNEGLEPEKLTEKQTSTGETVFTVTVCSQSESDDDITTTTVTATDNQGVQL